MFRISRTRFQDLMEKVMAIHLPIYKVTINRHGKKASSLEGRLLLPLKILAYGVATHTFKDYFQMSTNFARETCKEFDIAVALCYKIDYLRCPTPQDVKSIDLLHRSVHGVNGLFGSLDCTHTFWNCPKAWQGSYSGKEHRPSIILEAICDNHTFFWHASYGSAGRQNDLTILAASPFHHKLINGKFEKLEQQSNSVPFMIDDDQFSKMYILVDGIYPDYARFVKGIKEPANQRETKFTGWQEACRKDIERSFGIMKSVWKFTANDILLHNLNDISNRMTTCLILHNVVVADRIMGNVALRYDPAHCLDEDVENWNNEPLNLSTREESEMHEREESSADLLSRTDAAKKFANARNRWRELSDKNEHGRLVRALMNHVEKRVRN